MYKWHLCYFNCLGEWCHVYILKKCYQVVYVSYTCMECIPVCHVRFGSLNGSLMHRAPVASFQIWRVTITCVQLHKMMKSTKLVKNIWHILWIDIWHTFWWISYSEISTRYTLYGFTLNPNEIDQWYPLQVLTKFWRAPMMQIRLQDPLILLAS